jgi:hypothetical protein
MVRSHMKRITMPVHSNHLSGDLGGSRGLNDQIYVPCEEDPMCGQAIDHINQAQSALQNGDTQGAHGHLDLVK